MDIRRESLEERISDYFDGEIEWADLRSRGMGLTRNGGRFNAKDARAKLLKTDEYDAKNITRYSLYPLDSRWAYHSNSRPLWNEPRPALAAQAWEGNQFFVVRMFAERPQEHAPLIVTSLLPDYHLLRPNAVAIPFRIRHEQDTDDGHHGRIKARADAPTGTTANLSLTSREYLTKLGLAHPDGNPDAAAPIWLHAAAIGYSPFYLSENADGVLRDWPRIPMPMSKDVLLASAALGSQITALLNTESGVKNITTGSPRPELKLIGVLTTIGPAPLDPEKDLSIDIGWGHHGKNSVIMPGKGRIIMRDYTVNEQAALGEGCAAIGLAIEEALAQLGDHTFDVYLNDRVYWSNIPTKVWGFAIGGYQVIKSGLAIAKPKSWVAPSHPKKHITSATWRAASRPSVSCNHSSMPTTRWSRRTPTHGRALVCRTATALPLVGPWLAILCDLIPSPFRLPTRACLTEPARAGGRIGS